MEQIGLFFAALKSVVLGVSGTWDRPNAKATAAGHTARLDAAETALLRCLASPARPLFSACINAERDALARQLEQLQYEPAETFAVWGVRGQYEAPDLGDFVMHCESMAGAAAPDGYEYKFREEATMHMAALHVPGLGTLTARIWPGLSAGLDFLLNDRDTVFLANYKDSAPSIELDSREWPLSMAQRFCESGGEVPIGITHMVDGRDYVVTSLTSGGAAKGWTADAWSILPAADWDGQTYTYQSMIDAYDAGSLQRGDHRGQLIKIRGVLCVLERYAVMTDKAGSQRGLVDVAADEDDNGEAQALEDDEKVTA